MPNIVTLDELKAYLNLDDVDTYDDELEAMLPKVNSPILRGDGRKFAGIGRYFTETVVEDHDGGSGLIRLRLWPAMTITTVVEYAGSSAVEVLEQITGEAAVANGWRHEHQPAGLLRRYVGGAAATWAGGHANVQVTYETGWEGDPEAAAAIQEAACKLLGHMWKPGQFGVVNEAGGVTANIPAPSGFLLPHEVVSLLGPYERPVLR